MPMSDGSRAVHRSTAEVHFNITVGHMNNTLMMFSLKKYRILITRLNRFEQS